VEQLEGPYPSPALLIDGADVTGKPLVQQPSCRLDLPTEEQIMAALARVSGGSESAAKIQWRNPNASAAPKVEPFTEQLLQSGAFDHLTFRRLALAAHARRELIVGNIEGTSK